MASSAYGSGLGLDLVNSESLEGETRRSWAFNGMRGARASAGSVCTFFLATPHGKHAKWQNPYQSPSIACFHKLFQPTKPSDHGLQSTSSQQFGEFDWCLSRKPSRTEVFALRRLAFRGDQTRVKVRKGSDGGYYVYLPTTDVGPSFSSARGSSF